ncbi:hypothetical protein [Bacillus toyonensis]|uniref:hypothetical protein n=1 Tax=Bacillus toyonensis TaxID=155322 RepID=UPI002E1F3BE6|nr:hypothetical protein [Bacillus toyonensis]
MEQLRFEEKGTWLSLEVDVESFKLEWQSNQNDYKKWPEGISKEYAKALLEVSKKLDDQDKQLEMFFEAKGIVKKGRLFKEFFRGMNWDYNDTEKEYIAETKQQAAVYYNNLVIGM